MAKAEITGIAPFFIVKSVPDKNLWMTVNLKLKVAGSYCYGDADDGCKKYGRLYTREAACKACGLLGKGWTLLTKNEWQELAGLYGTAGKDSVEARKKAYRLLLVAGSAQFNALLGGGRGDDGTYRRLEAHGFYWTATETDSHTAWFANFAKGSLALYHQSDGDKTDAFSVRCVKRNAAVKSFG